MTNRLKTIFHVTYLMCSPFSSFSLPRFKEAESQPLPVCTNEDYYCVFPVNICVSKFTSILIAFSFLVITVAGIVALQLPLIRHLIFVFRHAWFSEPKIDLVPMEKVIATLLANDSFPILTSGGPETPLFLSYAKPDDSKRPELDRIMRWKRRAVMNRIHYEAYARVYTTKHRMKAKEDRQEERRSARNRKKARRQSFDQNQSKDATKTDETIGTPMEAPEPNIVPENTFQHQAVDCTQHGSSDVQINSNFTNTPSSGVQSTQILTADEKQALIGTPKTMKSITQTGTGLTSTVTPEILPPVVRTDTEESHIL